MSKINLIIHGLNHATAEFHRQEADNLRNTDRALVSKIGLIIPLEPGCFIAGVDDVGFEVIRDRGNGIGLHQDISGCECRHIGACCQVRGCVGFTKF